MRKSVYILVIGILLSMTSCRKDFETVPSSGGLEFSKKIVYLDTVFTNISSSTYTLKVYNRSNKDIHIPILQLAKSDTKYRLMVDGMTGENGAGKIFSNVEILAKDSLFIFIEATVNIAQTEPNFTYNDQILFDAGSTNQQTVDLVTLIKDAKFIFPNRDLTTGIKETIAVTGFSDTSNVPSVGHTLSGDELHWTKDKPYVIYGLAVIPNGSTLTIDPGTSVYFHDGASLIVDNGAQLNINGQVNIFDADGKVTTKNEVTFEGDRLEPDYEDVPGQWGTVFIFSGTSSGIINSINHLTLKNATVGLFLQSNLSTAPNRPHLMINNSQIYNSSNYGILARNAIISSQNLVINLAGQASLACRIGGDYSFTHGTFNNNWNSTKQLAVSLSNYEQNPDGLPPNAPLVQANFKNCIIYGSNNVELILDKYSDTSIAFNPVFDHCLIKFNDAGTQLETDQLYNSIRDTNNNLGNLKNQDPKFKNISRNQMNLLETSSAIAKGSTLTFNFADILNYPRPASNPDMGAYQFHPN